MLRVADELLLLLINPRRGDLVPIPAWSLACALAGALLMDLTLEGRIATDPEALLLLNSAPLDDDLLDPVLAEITRSDVRPARFWVAHVAERGDEIRDKTLARLTAHGILEEVEEDGYLSLVSRVILTRLYPLPGQAGRDDVTLRVMRVLFSDDIPDPRDVVIIRLADACGAFDRLLSPSELVVAQERIALLGRMDLIVRGTAEVVRRDRPSSPGAAPSSRSRRTP